MPSNMKFRNWVNDLVFSNSMSGGLESSAYHYGSSEIRAYTSETYLWFNSTCAQRPSPGSRVLSRCDEFR